ncbi:MAG TPA: hypothetical protein ENK86_00425 [Campylobacterales bacterium]|nr:hypothetical protein [Campylobacterales bacterium]
MRKILPILLLFFTFFLHANNYQEAWQAVQKLEQKNLPKSALDKVNLIYQQAQKEADSVQLIKALLHKEKYQIELSEDGYLAAIEDIEAELTKSHPKPTQLLLKSILAQMVANYLDRHRYEIDQRTTLNDNNSSDMRTWSVEQLANRASQLYLASLDKIAQTLPIEHYQAILTEAQNSQGLRPTLYDFLAFRALEHFKNERYYLTQPSDRFSIDQPEALGTISTFVQHSFETKETDSFKYHALLIYQQLMTFHWEQKNHKALHHINLERLHFVKRHFAGANGTELYIEALNHLQTKYTHSEALYYLAEHYVEQQAYTQAMIYITQGLNNPDPYIVSRCQMLQRRIEAQRLGFEIESVNLPNENVLARINYRNLQHLFVHVMPIDDTTKNKLSSLPYDQKANFIQTLTPFREFNLTLPRDDDYRKHSTEISLGSYALGEYLVVMTKDGNCSNQPTYNTMTVSNLASLHRNGEFLVLNRTTGEPEEGVIANFYTPIYDPQKGTYTQTFLTQKVSHHDGLISAPESNEQYSVEFLKGEDRLNFNHATYYDHASTKQPQWSQDRVHFFTDRAIYRPGQSIHFKGLATHQSSHQKPNILTNKTITVGLINQHDQKVASKRLKTDAYGTFHGSFIAPHGTLNGSMKLVADIGGEKWVQVEEYKRPKFEVTFDPLAKSYRLGDTVTLKGIAKAYSGYGLDAAKVTYSVKRVASFPWIAWWRPQPLSPEMQSSRGKLTTDGTGAFSVTFDAIPDKSIAAEDQPNFSYEVTVNVTDQTGETQSNTHSVTLGYIAVQTEMLIENELDKNAANKLTLQTTDLDGTFQPLRGEITVEKLTPPRQVYRQRYWQEVDKPLYTKEQFEKLFAHYAYSSQERPTTKVQTLPFDTGVSKTLMLENLEQGEYLLTLHTSDRYGANVQKSKKITLYDASATTPPYPTDLWHTKDKAHYEVGSTATITLKTSHPKAYVLLGIERQEKPVKEQWIEVDKLAKELITVRKEDRGDILYTLTYVHNNRAFTSSHRLTVPWGSALDIEFITFRDKLKPNQEEEWKLKIRGKDKEKVMAQMVATMYDASLDHFIPSNFTQPQLFPHYQPLYSRRWEARHFTPKQHSSYWSNPTQVLPQRFHALNWFGLDSYGSDSTRYEYDVTYTEAAPPPVPAPAPVMESRIEEVSAETNIRELHAHTVEGTLKKKAPLQPLHIRSQLQETMFFKPNLQTDKEGNIILNFTTHDALTRWRFMAFAHTKALKIGMIEKEIVTQKELMVVTNLPRFFREKDTITLRHKIVNMSSKDLNGTCTMQLVNPLSNAPIFADQNFTQPFSVAKRGSTLVSFDLDIPDVENVPAIQHTLIAQTATHSDAEQVIKPILTNRMLITESKALVIHGKTSQSFTLQSLQANNSSTLKHHQLTLEITSNPMWYAIQSLPYLMEFPHECNEQLFNRYFANALATKVANSNPKIKQIFESWKSKEALQSALRTNAQLKSVLLEETPWVLDAQSHEEQMQHLGRLFDLHRMAKEQEQTFDKLIKRQNRDIGWSWFEGGNSNWYITQYIMEGFARLKKLGIDKTDLETVSMPTTYLDQQMLKSYHALLERVKGGYTTLEKDQLNTLLIHYLYTHSHFKNFHIPDKVQKARTYYLTQAKKFWTNKTLHEQALIALTMHNLGEKETAQAIVQSLKERAIVHEEKGMYFKYTQGFHWSEMPIETHALMIEVFHDIAQDQTSVEQLKTWLLKNKQTTHWQTTKATASAIYALLLDDQWLSNDQLVAVDFNTSIEYQPILKEAQAKAQKGTGYYQASFTEFDQNMSTVTLTNPNDTIAWGGLYWQYFEEMDKVKRFKETALTITKKLFLEKITDRGAKLAKIDKLPLKVGDRVKVVIEIETDRDMEFIMLKDARASAFEPINVLSQYKWQDGFGYYESTKDNASYFFIDNLARGKYIFEYPLVVTHRGEFSGGLTTIESMYAPEFRSHSEGIRVRVQ